MSHASNSTAAAGDTVAGSRHWNSALFSGVAVVLGLIAMAIVIIACSCKKSPPNSNGEAAAERIEMEMETKIVVIMAGDENPTYLANPVPSARHC
ncbi:Detected protein of unknown function [Hibiscus syriacus]|uniref:Uncharacterized protein n=1 Tax=Hibiscus syriacus TaxID=106335 RepID=A0A6A3BF47_HIBSY|nr:Detected protein of unknown function [Hibiscus syriacus]